MCKQAIAPYKELDKLNHKVNNYIQLSRTSHSKASIQKKRLKLKQILWIHRLLNSLERLETLES